MISKEEVLQALTAVQDPDLGKNIVELGFVQNIQISKDTVSFSIELTTPACPVKDLLKEEARRAVTKICPDINVNIEMTARVRSQESNNQTNLNLIKNIIPIASGKGGVGKSTLSANLAIALANLGARVGLMDADVYGPSIPKLLGANPNDQPIQRNDKVIPPVHYGVKMISIAYFVPQGEAVIWRGPMLSKVIDDFLSRIEWGELDYLLVDLPPGTGDIQLSLCQKIALTGAVIISTPQDLAFEVAQKAIVMFKKLNTPILGLIENMSGSQCPHCGHALDIFGKGGAREKSMAHDIPYLGCIPLSQEIRQSSDSGHPITSLSDQSPTKQSFETIAKNMAAQVSSLHLGERSENQLGIKDIYQPTPNQTTILWNDKTETTFELHELRYLCPCAMCVHEISGEKLIQRSSIDKNIRIISMDPIGRYAMRFVWSDGHSTGIYSYQYLRSIHANMESKSVS